MAVDYLATCSCDEALCAGVAHSEDDAQRAIAHFSKRLGAKHSEHSMTVTIVDQNGWMAELASARTTIVDLRRELADLRAIAQAALNKGDIWHNAAVYQQALEDIASEEQDDEAS